MSTGLHCRGSDEPDPVAVEAREPDVALRSGRDTERCPDVDTAGVVGLDLAVGTDPADAVVCVGEPQVAVGPHGDGAWPSDAGSGAVERVDAPLRGDAPDAVRAGAGEPKVPVGARHDLPREDDVGSAGVKGGDLSARGDATDTAVVERVPQVAVGTGGQPHRTGAVVRDLKGGDVSIGRDASDPAIEGGKPQCS